MARAVALLAPLALLTAAPCGAAPPADVTALIGEAVPGFAQAIAPRRFVFPDDHGPHPEFRQEWWYVTGNLDADDGARFGFELTFFRYALAPLPEPPAAAPPAGSAWRTRELYLAHFAISDVGAQRYRFAEKLSREALGLAGARSPPLRVWIDDWQFAAAAPSGGEGGWTIRASQPGYQIDLELEAPTPPVLNGEAGLSRKSADSASYYYSIPRLKVRGRLTRDGRPVAVHGLAWLDREWGSSDLAAGQAGWDWFGLQLGDGTALMFYALRDRDGSRDSHSAGTWVEATGAAHALASADVDIEVSDHWTSSDGVRYPSGWRLRVPSLALDLAVRPVLADQELRTRPRYWEGAVDVSGTRGGGALAGRGYVELVGYAAGR